MTTNCDNCGQFTKEDDGDWNLCSDCWHVRLHQYGVEWVVETRKEVIKRQSYKCMDCGMTQAECKKQYGRKLSVHHVVPKDQGGSDDPANLVALCSKCHALREDAHENLPSG